MTQLMFVCVHACMYEKLFLILRAGPTKATLQSLQSALGVDIILIPSRNDPKCFVHTGRNLCGAPPAALLTSC